MGIGFFVILIPFAIYLIAGLTQTDEIKTPDDFFIAYRKVGSTPFANSSIAYGFQVATVYPFIIWASTGSISLALANSFFWGAGIILFSFVIPKLKQFIGTDKTLHGFIGERYESSRLRIITSYLTIIGVSGVVLAEIVWGSSVLAILVGDSKPIKNIILFVMVFYVSVYILKGGQLSSIKTDQVQLIFSYIGVFIIIGYDLFVLIKNNITLNFTSSFSVIFLIISLSGILWIRKFRFFSYFKPSTNKLTVKAISSNAFISLLFIMIIGLALYALPKLSFSNAQASLSIKNFGILTLLAYSIMPLLWQFSDMTNWQRILSVEINNDHNHNRQIEQITKGMRVYGFESPFSWFSIIALGAFASLAFPGVIANGDPFYNIPNLLISSAKWYEQLFGYMFIVSILAIMLSTVDSAITAIMFTFTYDAFPVSRKILDSKDNAAIEKNSPAILAIGRTFIIIFILFLSSYILIDKYGFNGDKFIGMLFAFYTAQLSFAIPVIAAITFKSLPRNDFVIASIVISASFGVVSGLCITFKGLEAYQWLPIIGSIFLSAIIFCSGYLGVKRNG